MTLIVQIRCPKEVCDIADVIRSVPRSIEGIDAVEFLVIDDGSSDGTPGNATEAGSDHIVANRKTIGLARPFQRGISTALSLGADIIVNTDGEGLHEGHSIADLVGPIVRGEADIVVGDRRQGQKQNF